MANARTRFDNIMDYMIRANEVVGAPLFGRPAGLYRGEAFVVFHGDGLGVRLRGRARLQALALAGTKFWDPMGRDVPNMDWVSIPVAHFLRWDRFAIDALHQAKAGPPRPVAAKVEGPPPKPPAATRWADNIKSLLAKIESLSLTPQAAQAEKPRSRLDF